MEAQAIIAVNNAQTEENSFLALFDRVFESRNEGRLSDDGIVESIQDFVDYFRENASPAGACAANNFQNRSHYLGYFYWFSPTSAAVTRNKTLIALQNCEEFLACFQQPSLKVVSVGGGPGSDLVGLYSAISEKSSFQDMDLLLIDNIVKWKLYFHAIHRLLREGDFGDASELIKNRRINTSFVCADMREELTPECEEALKEADLVWMKGFLSVLRDNKERYAITEEIISLMKPGALLVVMESLAYDRFDAFEERNQIRKVFNTEGDRFMLHPSLQSKYRIIKSTNLEIIIFQRMDD